MTSTTPTPAPRWTPATLVAHLTEHLPAAWQLSVLPSEMRHRSGGARLDFGNYRVYVAATARRCSVLAVYRKPIPGYPMFTEPSVLVFYQTDFLPAGLLRAVRAAAEAVVALYPCEAPEWASVRPVLIVHVEDRKARCDVPAYAGFGTKITQYTSLCGVKFHNRNSEHSFANRYLTDHVRPTCEACVSIRQANKQAKKLAKKRLSRPVAESTPESAEHA